MNIDYISDLHLDFYVKVKGDDADYTERTRAFLAELLPEVCADVLVVAGDLSHYNRQSFDTLKFFSEHYAQVFFVFGNHDYYLVSNKQRRKYHERSAEREVELIELVSALDRIQVLQKFEVAVYNGVRFAGATNWYSLELDAAWQFYRDVSNDSVLIKKYMIAEQHQEEMAAYREMPSVDVLITHVPPIEIDSHRAYGNSYCYLNELETVKASVCVFGHCHEQQVYEQDGVTFAINALGYPDQKLARQIRTVRVEKTERE
ncbi:MAG: metallophosphoesterase [Solibacillus sp.]